MMLRSLIAAAIACVLQATLAAAHPSVSHVAALEQAVPITAREDSIRTYPNYQVPSQRRSRSSGSETALLELARSQVGVGAVYGRRSLWCARFMNWALERSGYRGTGSDLAKSFLALPHTSPHVGAIAVLSRGRGGHVGIVAGFDGEGNPILVSGNHGHRVGVGAYPRRRVLAYVSPARS